MNLSRHCYHCGWEWTLRTTPARTETCHQCGLDLKVCLNCVHYDRGYAHQCRERRAEPVDLKEQANFCEFFDWSLREWKGQGALSKEAEAKERLKRLLGD